MEGLEDDKGEIADDDQYLYDPYGENEKVPAAGHEKDDDAGLSDAAKDNPFRFEGFYYDSGVRNYDMQARDYRPDIGRFASQDQFESAAGDQVLQSDPLTQNRYAFAGGNPITNVEFDGHDPPAVDTHYCGGDPSCSHATKHQNQQAGRAEARANHAQTKGANNPARSGAGTGQASPSAAGAFQQIQAAVVKPAAVPPPLVPLQGGFFGGPLLSGLNHLPAPSPREDRGFRDYLQNDLGGDLKGSIGTDLGIGDPHSQTYQEGKGFYSRPEVQVGTAFIPIGGAAIKGLKGLRAIRAARATSGAAKPATSLIAGENGVVVSTSRARLEESLAGLPSRATIKAPGREYALPDGSLVRIMEPSGQAPLRASFTNAQGAPISPFTGKPIQAPPDLTAGARRQYVRNRTHIRLGP